VDQGLTGIRSAPLDGDGAESHQGSHPMARSTWLVGIGRSYHRSPVWALKGLFGYWAMGWQSKLLPPSSMDKDEYQ